MKTYNIYLDHEEIAVIKYTRFTASMIAMDLSDRKGAVVDLLDGESGEVLATWDHGIMTYDADA